MFLARLILVFLGFSLKDAEGDCYFKGEIGVKLYYEKDGWKGTDCSSEERKNCRKLLNFSIIDDRIRRLCKIKLYKGIFDGAFKRMIHRRLLNYWSFLFDKMSKGPNAVVWNYSVISEIKIVFTAVCWAKDNVVEIIKIVLNIDFLWRIDDRVRKVNGKV